MTHWAQDTLFSNGPRLGDITKVPPTAAQIAEGLIAGGTFPAGQVNWLLNHLSVATAGMYGDGSDGDLTVGGTVTLSRDMYYNTLTVPNGRILNTSGFRVFVRDVCDVQTGGLIRNNGIVGEAAASNNPGNSQINVTIGSMGGLTAHITAAGVVGSGPGTDAIAIANGIGGVGGVGGNSVFYPAAVGGDGGVITAPPGNAGGYRVATPSLGLLMANTNQAGITHSLPLVGGSAGGSGGVGGVNNSASGSSGGPGGLVALFAHSLLLGGRVEAEGGAGGAAFFGGVGSDSAGGSGGGGGGALWIITRSLTGAGVLSVDGGQGSAGAGALVTAGANGSVGTIIQLTA